MADFRYEESTGIIHCSGGGFWSVEAVQQTGEAIQEAMRRCRRAYGSVAMLVVTDNALVQTAEVMEATRRRMQAWGPDDRIAVVLSSTLVTMQAKRTLSSGKLRIFASENEALDWLTNDRQALPSASTLATGSPGRKGAQADVQDHL